MAIRFYLKIASLDPLGGQKKTEYIKFTRACNNENGESVFLVCFLPEALGKPYLLACRPQSMTIKKLVKWR